MKNLLVFLIASLGSFAASADQCAFVSQQQAVLAARLISPGSTVVRFCELCPDQTAVEETAEQLSAAPVDFRNYWALSINGERVDLAYTFLKVGGAYINVAGVVGCPAHDVSTVVNSLSDFQSER